MGLLSPLASRSIAACRAVFATQLSRAAGLPLAVAGTMPVLTAKYPAPASTASVKMTPRKKLAIDLIYMLSLLKQGFGPVINSVLARANPCRSWAAHHEEPLSLSRKTSSFFIGYW